MTKAELLTAVDKLLDIARKGNPKEDLNFLKQLHTSVRFLDHKDTEQLTGDDLKELNIRGVIRAHIESTIDSINKNQPISPFSFSDYGEMPNSQIHSQNFDNSQLMSSYTSPDFKDERFNKAREEAYKNIDRIEAEKEATYENAKEEAYEEIDFIEDARTLNSGLSSRPVTPPPRSATPPPRPATPLTLSPLGSSTPVSTPRSSPSYTPLSSTPSTSRSATPSASSQIIKISAARFQNLPHPPSKLQQQALQQSNLKPKHRRQQAVTDIPNLNAKTTQPTTQSKPRQPVPQKGRPMSR